MGISHEHATEDDLRRFFHDLATGFDRERLLGPRQVVTVLLVMIREQCGYDRGLILTHERYGDAFGWTMNSAASARADVCIAPTVRVYSARGEAVGVGQGRQRADVAVEAITGDY